MKSMRFPAIALTWTPQGKEKLRRPTGTLRKKEEEESTVIGKSQNELRRMTQDRVEWRLYVGTLCSSKQHEKMEELTWVMEASLTNSSFFHFSLVLIHFCHEVCGFNCHTMATVSTNNQS